MNVGDSARLFAAEGEYERSTRNRVVMSGKGKCVVRLEEVYRRAAAKLTMVPGEQRVLYMSRRGPRLEHLHQQRLNGYML